MVITTIGLALVMRDRLRRGVPIGRAMWIAVFVTALALGNAKAPYFLVVGVFALPWLSGRGNTRRLLVAAAALTVVVGAVWSVGFGDRYVLGAYVGPEHARGIEAIIGAAYSGLDSTAQWKALRGNPTIIAAAGFRMLTHQGRSIFSQSLFDYGLWVPAWWLSLLGFAFLVETRFSTPEDDRARLTGVERSLVWLLLAVITGLMLLSLFVYDTPAHQSSLEITGMQGRYVAPLIPLLVLAIPAVGRMRIQVPWLRLGQLVASGVVVFAAAFGAYPPLFKEIFRQVLR